MTFSEIELNVKRNWDFLRDVCQKKKYIFVEMFDWFPIFFMYNIIYISKWNKHNVFKYKAKRVNEIK
jgi:hypothetical protein